jgi:hypothetical protein
MLLHKIKKKIVVNKIVRLEFDTFNKILNSELSFVKRLLRIIKFLVGRAQNKGKVRTIKRKVLIQLRERLKKDEGSKTENRFLIIVNFFLLREIG